MLHSLQEMKCDALLLLLSRYLLVFYYKLFYASTLNKEYIHNIRYITQTKFKQQQLQQQQKTALFQYENSTKASRLHFSDLQ